VRVLNGDAVPCSEGNNCKYSPQNAGEQGTRCVGCRLSPEHDSDDDLPSNWKPLDKRLKHPKLEQEKRARHYERQRELRDKRLSKDKNRKRVITLAEKAERDTERQIIKATKNSGRSNKDGDHLAGDLISLDTKLQTKRLHPVVNANELAKIRNDAKTAGALLGGLIIRSKTGLGVVVFHEDDFAKILQLIKGQKDNA
jgi:hypothetical protein